MPELDGKVALITGAGSPTGIGFATARIMGREGALLAVTSTTGRIHERAAELQQMGFIAAGFVADLTNAGEAGAMVNEVLTRFDHIDILVNNAGMVQVGGEQTAKRFVDMDEADWENDFAINLKTAFNATHAVLPAMIERGWGRVVDVSSVTGPLVTNPESTGYSAAKAGVDGLTRGLAVEVARHGITVNSVAPGWIATGSSTPEELIAGRHTPIGRPGTPEEVGELIAFLASERASYITGQAVVVDGGNTIQEYKGPPELYY